MADVPAAPYARIAAELRARIEAGELAAGDRVPSAREITRRWGVAIATASRVLATLRGEGLVRAVPGVGTVVVSPSPSPSPSPTSLPPTSSPMPPPSPPQLAVVPPRVAVAPGRRGPGVPAAFEPGRRDGVDGALAPDRIVAAAIAIADREGLAALSMRRLATDLGAGPMSLYRHVADKDDLLLRMMDAALREWRLPADPPGGWRPRLELALRMLWATFRRHPWLAPAMSLTRPQPIAAGLVYTEWTLAALDGMGLDLAEMFDIHLTLFNYVRGTAINLEPEIDAEASSGLTVDEWMEAQQPTLRSIVDTERFPLFTRLIGLDYDLDLDALFERGAAQLLDGLEIRLARPADAGRSAAGGQEWRPPSGTGGETEQG